MSDKDKSLMTEALEMARILDKKDKKDRAIRRLRQLIAQQPGTRITKS